MFATRRFALGILCSALLPGLGLAQKPAAPKVPTPGTAPVVAVNAPGPWANKFFMPEIDKNRSAIPPAVISHDFGTVPFGTLCTQKFNITNIYDVPIQVIDVRVECGCLKGYPPNKVLLPNESAEFVVSMNSAMFKGKQSKKMYVTFGPNYVSTAELKFEATSRQDISLAAPGEIDFGTLAQGGKAAKQLAITYSGTQSKWEITGPAATAGPFEVKVEKTSHGLIIGTVYTLFVSLKKDAPAGELSDTIVLKTNDPATPQVLVNVRGFVQAPITASPGRVDFGEMKAGDIASHRVLVRSSTATKIAAVADAGDGITVETFSGEAQQQAVVVKFAPSKPGPFKKEVKLVSSLPGNPVTIVVIEANVTK
jgi:hypothetical protein